MRHTIVVGGTAVIGTDVEALLPRVTRYGIILISILENPLIL